MESHIHYYYGHARRSECYNQFIEVLGAQLKPQQTSSGVSSTAQCTCREQIEDFVTGITRLHSLHIMATFLEMPQDVYSNRCLNLQDLPVSVPSWPGTLEWYTEVLDPLEHQGHSKHPVPKCGIYFIPHLGTGYLLYKKYPVSNLYPTPTLEPIQAVY